MNVVYINIVLFVTLYPLLIIVFEKTHCIGVNLSLMPPVLCNFNIRSENIVNLFYKILNSSLPRVCKLNNEIDLFLII